MNESEITRMYEKVTSSPTPISFSTVTVITWQKATKFFVQSLRIREVRSCELHVLPTLFGNSFDSVTHCVQVILPCVVRLQADNSIDKWCTDCD